MSFKRQRQSKMVDLLSLDLGSESSDDSDFRIEDHKEDDFSDVSKDGDDGDDDSSGTSNTSDDNDNDDDDDDNDDDGMEDESEDSTQQLKQLLADNDEANAAQMNGVAATATTNDIAAVMKNIENNRKEKLSSTKLPLKAICCVCLGDRSDDSNEIVECDNCGVSVHEGCYGVSDNTSISSTNSTCSTEPWFCEACRAGVSNPVCELCPKEGGIFKETDVNRWVHLVCALYVPGVAFGEVDQLSSVTLFEMQYSKWGAKACSLCDSLTMARTGVCIGCDAGMCKTYFHVTCAQAAGFLTEAHHEEADAVDPFYAHCKMHSEKELMKKRKRNYQIFCLNMQQKVQDRKLLRLDDPCPEQMRIQRKLLKQQSKYALHKQLKGVPWVPTQKMPRLLNTSTTANKRMQIKAQAASIDLETEELKVSQIEVLQDIRKKWHIPAAFNVEFVAYYLDRISRTQELKDELTKMLKSNVTANEELNTKRREYEAQIEAVKAAKEKNESLLGNITKLHKEIMFLVPSKNLPNPINIGQTPPEEPIAKISTPPSRPISVPTAAALKMGVGFPLPHFAPPPGTKVNSTRLLSTQAAAKGAGAVAGTNLNVIAPNLNVVVTTATPVNVAATAAAMAATSTAATARSIATTASSSSGSSSGLAAAAPPSTSSSALVVQNFECGICKRCNDQHLLTKCDTCKLYYHLGCLNPPLTRPPKKSKLYAWQCSECDKSDVSDGPAEVPKGPRKARTRFNKDGSIISRTDSDNNGECKNYENTTTLGNRNDNTTTMTTHYSLELTPQKQKEQKSLVVSHLPHEEVIPHKKTKTSVEQNTAPVVQLGKRKMNSDKQATALISPPPQWKKSKIKTSAGESDGQTLDHHTTTQQGVMPHTPVLINPPILIDLTTSATKSTTTTTTSTTKLEDDITTELQQQPEIETNAKQLRKQKRKEKHKNKHNTFSTDTEKDKSHSKEHKRKRKKREQHENEMSEHNIGGGVGGDSTGVGSLAGDAGGAAAADDVPKIKIRFKTLPYPGNPTPEPTLFYVSAALLRSAGEEGSRATSEDSMSQTADDNPMSQAAITPPIIPPLTALTTIPITTPIIPSPKSERRNAAVITPNSTNNTNTALNLKTTTTTTTPTSNKKVTKRKGSPRKALTPQSVVGGTVSASSIATPTATTPSSGRKSNQVQNFTCCVCTETGISSNTVTCDECRKSYHFACLDPPLKKTPKIRGYSWHCADCDPTDDERK